MVDVPPVLIVPGRERYHEVTLNAWATILGVAYLFGAPLPTSMAAFQLPGVWRYVWALGLLWGGAIALLGSYWLSNVERGLELERAGLVMLTGSLLIYVVAVIGWAGWPGGMAAGIATAWVWANGMRAIRITRDLRHIDERNRET